MEDFKVMIYIYHIFDKVYSKLLIKIHLFKDLCGIHYQHSFLKDQKHFNHLALKYIYQHNIYKPYNVVVN